MQQHNLLVKFKQDHIDQSNDLIKCHQYHEEWLDSTKADTSTAPPILQVNCNLENTPETILLWQQQLEQFITPLIIW